MFESSSPPSRSALAVIGILLLGAAAPADDTPTVDPRRLQARVDAVLTRVVPATVGLRIGRTGGSGVIVSPDGLVLTAAHVIGSAGADVTVILQDGTELKAEALGVNRPDQCGGPLIDLDGGVVGINIARAGRVATYAIPAAEMRQIVDRLSTRAAGESGESSGSDR